MSEHLQSIIQRLASGERAAVRDLYAAKARTLYGIAYQILRDDTDALEALRHTFLQIWKLRAERAGLSNGHEHWLAAMAHRSALALSKQRPEEVSTPRKHAAKETDLAQIRALTGLTDTPDDDLKLLANAYLNAEPATQLAQQHNMSPNDVQAKLKQTVNRLRKTDR